LSEILPTIGDVIAKNNHIINYTLPATTYPTVTIYPASIILNPKRS